MGVGGIPEGALRILYVCYGAVYTLPGLVGPGQAKKKYIYIYIYIVYISMYICIYNIYIYIYIDLLLRRLIISYLRGSDNRVEQRGQRGSGLH